MTHGLQALGLISSSSIISFIMPFFLELEQKTGLGVSTGWKNVR